MKDIIRIATRKSPLALKQANVVKELIQTGKDCEIVAMTSSGDTLSNKKFKEHGGKGLFLKELEESLIADQSDIAVHSLKDVPAVVENRFRIASISKRENPADVLISDKYKSIEEMPNNAIIGTSSPRRLAMLKNISKNFDVVSLRGNIQTRLEKMKSNKLDGIILAAAGLHRMGLENQIKQYLPLDKFTPSAGQGILCVQYLKENKKIREIISRFVDTNVQACADIEREFIKYIHGDCMSPIGVHATIKNKEIMVTAYVSSPDGHRHIRSKYVSKASSGDKPGEKLAKVFLKQGVKKLLKN